MIANEAAFDAVRIHNCGQDEIELSIVLEIVRAMEPDLIVEIGCDTGGSLFAWRSTGADVIGVSLGVQTPGGIMDTHGATLITGDSHSPETLRRLRKELDGRRPDFLWIDGDHSEEGCRLDWLLAQEVGARAVGFHDISPRRIPGDPGVRKVFAEACARHASAIIRNPDDPHNPGAGIVWLT